MVEGAAGLGRKGKAVKKALLAVAAVGLSAVIFVLIVATPPPSQSRCLQFTVSQGPSNSAANPSCSVAVSNVSDSPVLYAGGFNKIWLEVAYRTNGVWQNTRVWTPGGGNGVLPPHAGIKDTVEVPFGATAVRVGLPITSLTWRGRFAWYVVGHCPEALYPVARLFMAPDERRRSGTEWSNDYAVQSAGRQ